MDALILAGGENRRIQVQKGLLEFNGKRIIERCSALFEKHFNKVFISTNSPEIYFYLEFCMIGDTVDYRGPMTGIFSTLVCTGASEIFVAACDMPFINDNVISIITDDYNGQDAVIPVFNGRPQPLLGIYSRTVMRVMEERIRFKKRSMMDLLSEISVHFIKEDKIRKIDPEGRSFVNINTMNDFKKAQFCHSRPGGNDKRVNSYI